MEDNACFEASFCSATRRRWLSYVQLSLRELLTLAGVNCSQYFGYQSICAQSISTSCLYDRELLQRRYLRNLESSKYRTLAFLVLSRT